MDKDLTLEETFMSLIELARKEQNDIDYYSGGSSTNSALLILGTWCVMFGSSLVYNLKNHEEEYEPELW